MIEILSFIFDLIHILCIIYLIYLILKCSIIIQNDLSDKDKINELKKLLLRKKKKSKRKKESEKTLKKYYNEKGKSD